MRGPTSVFERGDFVVERLPFSPKYVRARDNHVDFVGTSFHRAANFRHAFLEGRKTGWESRGDCRNMNATSFDRAPCGFHKGVINADGSDLYTEALDTKLLHKFVLNRLSRLGAQSPNTLVGVIAGERRQIHAGDGAQEPSCLPFLLDRPPGADGLRAALDRGGGRAPRFIPLFTTR